MKGIYKKINDIVKTKCLSFCSCDYSAEFSKKMQLTLIIFFKNKIRFNLSWLKKNKNNTKIMDMLVLFILSRLDHKCKIFSIKDFEEFLSS